MKSERTVLQTIDGVTIVGDWSFPEKATKAVLLLHMMPATRASFDDLAKALNEAGMATLAIDLRGHGESHLKSPGHVLDYKNFTDAEHQSSKLDVDTAINFLKRKGFIEDHMYFVGASIGANLSLDALVRYKDAKRAVLLSPGLDYRGLKTESLMKEITPPQKVFIVASEGDSYSADSSKQLAALSPSQTVLKIIRGSEHGTNMFKAEPQLIAQIVDLLP